MLKFLPRAPKPVLLGRGSSVTPVMGTMFPNFNIWEGLVPPTPGYLEYLASLTGAP